MAKLDSHTGAERGRRCVAKLDSHTGAERGEGCFLTRREAQKQVAPGRILTFRIIARTEGFVKRGLPAKRAIAPRRGERGEFVKLFEKNIVF